MKSPGRAKCECCGEVIPFPTFTRDAEGQSRILCHECNGDKERLLARYSADGRQLHDWEDLEERVDDEG